MQLTEYINAGFIFAERFGSPESIPELKRRGFVIGNRPTLNDNLLFDEDNEDYLVVKTGVKKQIEFSTELSIIARIKVNNLASDHTILATDAFGANAQFIFWVDVDGFDTGNVNTVSCLVSDGTNDAKIEGNSNLLDSNQWHVIAMTFEVSSATGLRLYVDGVEAGNSPQSTSAISALAATTNDLYIGASPSLEAGKYFDGNFSHLLIIQRRLTEDEILDIHNDLA